MRRTSGEWRGVSVVAAALAATAACMPAPPNTGISNPNNIPQVLAWTGVRAVAATLTTPADPAAPVALAEGMGGAIYVQWNTTTAATITRFNASGTAQAQALTLGGRAGRGAAVLTCVNSSNHTQDCPLLAAVVDTPDPGVSPELLVRDCLNSTLDWSLGSTLGMLLPAGGSRAFLAARYNAWSATNPPVPGPDVELMVTPVRVGAGTPCAIGYAEDELYGGTALTANSDGYDKGRLLPLTVPASFIVGAAARLGTDAMVVAGANGAAGSAWVISLDSHFAPVNQAALPVGGTASTTVASVAVDASGNVFVCGTSRSGLFPFSNVVAPQPPQQQQQTPFNTSGWVVQGAPDLTGWKTLALPLTVDGCAFTKSGALVVSGTYSGTFQGQASASSDAFLALVTPGSGGAAPALASFAHYGSPATETIVSAPLVASYGSIFLGGVTKGDWGVPAGTSTGKVFVARIDPITLALQ